MEPLLLVVFGALSIWAIRVVFRELSDD